MKVFTAFIAAPAGQAASIVTAAAAVVGTVAGVQSALTTPIDPASTPTASVAGNMFGHPVAAAAFLPEAALFRADDSTCWVSLPGLRRLTVRETNAPGTLGRTRRQIGLDRSGRSDAQIDFLYPVSGFRLDAASVLVSGTDVSSDFAPTTGLTGCVRGPAAPATQTSPAPRGSPNPTPRP
jgi:hypothetical protein